MLKWNILCLYSVHGLCWRRTIPLLGLVSVWKCMVSACVMYFCERVGEAQVPMLHAEARGGEDVLLGPSLLYCLVMCFHSDPGVRLAASDPLVSTPRSSPALESQVCVVMLGILFEPWDLNLSFQACIPCILTH